MSKHLLMSLNLVEPESAEADFSARLNEEHWAEVPGLRDAWICHISGAKTADSALSAARSSIARAAKFANVVKYQVAIQVGDSPTDEWNQDMNFVRKLE